MKHIHATVHILMAVLASIVSLLSTPVALAAGDAESQFGATFRLLEQADTARSDGDNAKARRLYGAAIAAYEELSERYPAHQPEMVKFRIAYCRNQIAQLKGLQQQPRAAIGVPSLQAIAAPNARPLTGAVVKGLAFCRSGQFQRAVNTLTPYLETSTDDGLGHLVASTAYLGLGNKTNAIASLQQAISADPTLAEAHYNLCQLLVRQTEPDFAAARTHYTKAIELGAGRDEDLEAVLGILEPTTMPDASEGAHRSE